MLIDELQLFRPTRVRRPTSYLLAPDLPSPPFSLYTVTWTIDRFLRSCSSPFLHSINNIHTTRDETRRNRHDATKTSHNANNNNRTHRPRLPQRSSSRDERRRNHRAPLPRSPRVRPHRAPRVHLGPRGPARDAAGLAPARGLDGAYPDPVARAAPRGAVPAVWRRRWGGGRAGGGAEPSRRDAQE